ncbi:hypothetical protein [Ferruginibacter albus]|uniref:hypothetical protein n=1 Tax=Ferruginibacter albus TaxID=2875540 RepID=UPI001CC5319B|nr:hypothetical protein [Ferruginibacter albus]UAY51422.1 hypothetical protein K9M53_12590 [Ferruginibacter albus]
MQPITNKSIIASPIIRSLTILSCSKENTTGGVSLEDNNFSFDSKLMVHQQK